MVKVATYIIHERYDINIKKVNTKIKLHFFGK